MLLLGCQSNRVTDKEKMFCQVDLVYSCPTCLNTILYMISNFILTLFPLIEINSCNTNHPKSGESRGCRRKYVLYILIFSSTVRPLFLVREEIDDEEVTCADLVTEDTELLLALPSDAIAEYCEVMFSLIAIK